MNWFENIKRIKKESRLKNSDIAERSDVSLGTVNKLFAGEIGDPKLSTLVTLANCFGVSLDTLVGLNSNEYTLEPEYAGMFARLDEDGRNAVHLIIEHEYNRRCKALDRTIKHEAVRTIRSIPLYNTGASAGTGSGRR